MPSSQGMHGCLCCRADPYTEALEIKMAKVLVLYYSSYGHVETMANAVAEGARSAGATVDIKRVPETAPADVAKAAHFKLEQSAPIAAIDDLANYDAIIVGSPTHAFRPRLLANGQLP